MDFLKSRVYSTRSFDGKGFASNLATIWGGGEVAPLPPGPPDTFGPEGHKHNAKYV